MSPSRRQVIAGPAERLHRHLSQHLAVDGEVGGSGPAILVHDRVVFGYGRLVCPGRQLEGLEANGPVQELGRQTN